MWLWGQFKTIEDIKNALASDDETKISDALWAIQDLVLLSSEKESLQLLRIELMERTPEVWTTIEHMLFSPNRGIRSHACHVIGKTGHRESIPILHQAVDWEMAQDPFSIGSYDGGLLFELIWLGEYDFVLQTIEQMTTHTNYLYRWAAVEVSSYLVLDKREAMLAVLRHDEDENVRAEAEYRYQEMQHEARLETMATKAEKRTGRRLVEGMCPTVTFCDFARQVCREEYEASHPETLRQSNN
jgi:HEAT repeat protein